MTQQNEEDRSHSLYLATGYWCNHACCFCPCGRDGRKARTFETESVLSQIDAVFATRDIRLVTLSGGEPTLQPCFFPVLARLAREEVNVEILSNGETLADPDLIRQISETFPTERLSFITAFHSCNEVTHEQVNGSKGSFRKSIRGLHQLEEYGISYSIKHVINRYAYTQLPVFVSWVNGEFPKANFLILTGMDLCGVDAAESEKVAVPCREVQPWLETALSAAEGLHTPVIVTDFPLCHVDPVYWYMVRLRHGSQSGAYIGMDQKGAGVATLNTTSDCGPFYHSCQDCDVRSVCPGMWRTSCAFFGEEDASAVVLQEEG